MKENKEKNQDFFSPQMLIVSSRIGKAVMQEVPQDAQSGKMLNTKQSDG